MAPEMFIGLGLSGLLIMMFGQSPAPKTNKTNKKTVVTFVLPSCDDDSIIKTIQTAGFERR